MSGKKFLDIEGVKTLWSELSMNDYPNNETLVGVISAIDETKQDKIAGTEGQIVGFDENGAAIARDGYDKEISEIKTEIETVYQTAATQSDWVQTDPSATDYIKNKPFGYDKNNNMNKMSTTWLDIPDTIKPSSRVVTITNDRLIASDVSISEITTNISNFNVKSSNLLDRTVTDIISFNGVYIAACEDQGIIYSTNKTEWAQSNITGPITIRKILAYSSSYYSRAVAITSKGIYYSENGKEWIQSNMTKSYSFLIVHLGLWVAASSTTSMCYSTDGKEWTPFSILEDEDLGLNSIIINYSSLLACSPYGVWSLQIDRLINNLFEISDWEEGVFDNPPTSFYNYPLVKSPGTGMVLFGKYYCDGLDEDHPYKVWSTNNLNISFDRIIGNNGHWYGIEYATHTFYNSSNGSDWVETGTYTGDIVSVGEEYRGRVFVTTSTGEAYSLHVGTVVKLNFSSSSYPLYVVASTQAFPLVRNMFYTKKYGTSVYVLLKGQSDWTTINKPFGSANITNCNILLDDDTNTYFAFCNNTCFYFSTDDNEWHKSSNLINSTDWTVYRTKNIWIATPDSQPNGIYYSEDGKKWVQSNITEGKSYYDITYGNGIWNMFLTADTQQQLYYSEDGKKWILNSNWTYSSSRITYNNGLWHIGRYYSVDGKNWQCGTGDVLEHEQATSEDFTVRYGNNIWLGEQTSYQGGAESYSSVPKFYYSKDGKMWQASNTPEGLLNKNQTLCGNGIWLCADNQNGVYYSEDGKEWVQSNITEQSAITIEYVNNMYFCTTEKNQLTIYYSIDGKQWTTCNGLDNNHLYKFSNIVYGNDLWIFWCDGGAQYISTDGKLWERQGGDLSLQNIQSIQYNVNNRIFLTSPRLGYSTDGKHWTSLGVNQSINSVVYSNETGLYCFSINYHATPTFKYAPYDTIKSSIIQPDWDEQDTSSYAYVNNRPMYKEYHKTFDFDGSDPDPNYYTVIKGHLDISGLTPDEITEEGYYIKNLADSDVEIVNIAFASSDYSFSNYQLYWMADQSQIILTATSISGEDSSLVQLISDFDDKLYVMNATADTGTNTEPQFYISKANIPWYEYHELSKDYFPEYPKPNWEENDSSSKDYISNRPCYDFVLDLYFEWDGDTTDREVITLTDGSTLTRVRRTPWMKKFDPLVWTTLEENENYNISQSRDLFDVVSSTDLETETPIVLYDSQNADYASYILMEMGEQKVVSVSSDNIDIVLGEEVVHFNKAGVYSMSNGTNFIKKVWSKTITKLLDEKYIPSTLFVKKTGDIMSGNLTITNNIYPSIIMSPTSDQGYVSVLEGSYKGATSIAAYNDTTGQNRRMLEVRNSEYNASLDKAIVLRDAVNGTISTYRVFHSGMYTAIPIINGGTGARSAAGALANLGAAAAVHTHTVSDITDLTSLNASMISEGTFSGAVAANAAATSMTNTSQLRNITINSTDLVDGESDLPAGEIYLVYEE